MDEKKMQAKFLFGNLKERDHWETLGVDGSIPLK
jgi:hypothetical protein